MPGIGRDLSAFFRTRILKRGLVHPRRLLSTAAVTPIIVVPFVLILAIAFSSRC
jgi:hypothetical protein